MPGNDLASVVEAAVTEKTERLEAKRFGKTKKPRTSLETSTVCGVSRHPNFNSVQTGVVPKASSFFTSPVGP